MFTDATVIAIAAAAAAAAIKVQHVCSHIKIKPNDEIIGCEALFHARKQKQTLACC